MSLPEQVASKINKTDNGCWVWTAAKDTGGQGVLRHGGKTIGARRHVYRLIKGEVRQSLYPACGDKSCVNPDHMTTEVPKKPKVEYKSGREWLCRKWRTVSNAKLGIRQTQFGVAV